MLVSAGWEDEAVEMSQQRKSAKPVAYWIITLGCILAMATALAPQPTGSYHLSGGFLMLGITPYIVYGCLTEGLKCCPLVGAGIALLVADLVARFGAQITYTANASVLPAVYLCLFLTLLVIPVGALLGRLVAKTGSWPDSMVGSN